MKAGWSQPQVRSKSRPPHMGRPLCHQAILAPVPNYYLCRFSTAETHLTRCVSCHLADSFRLFMNSSRTLEWLNFMDTTSSNPAEGLFRCLGSFELYRGPSPLFREWGGALKPFIHTDCPKLDDTVMVEAPFKMRALMYFSALGHACLFKKRCKTRAISSSLASSV